LRIYVDLDHLFLSITLTINDVLGDTLMIPDSVMGLTLLAAGMSVPEAASSVIVTNQGINYPILSTLLKRFHIKSLLCESGKEYDFCQFNHSHFTKV